MTKSHLWAPVFSSRARRASWPPPSAVRKTLPAPQAMEPKPGPTGTFQSGLAECQAIFSSLVPSWLGPRKEFHSARDTDAAVTATANAKIPLRRMRRFFGFGEGPRAVAGDEEAEAVVGVFGVVPALGLDGHRGSGVLRGVVGGGIAGFDDLRFPAVVVAVVLAGEGDQLETDVVDRGLVDGVDPVDVEAV